MSALDNSNYSHTLTGVVLVYNEKVTIKVGHDLAQYMGTAIIDRLSTTKSRCLCGLPFH